MPDIDIYNIDTEKFIANLLDKYYYVSRVKDLDSLYEELDQLLTIEQKYTIDQIPKVDQKQIAHFNTRLKKLQIGFSNEHEFNQFIKNYNIYQLSNEQVKRLKELTKLISGIENHSYLLNKFNIPKRDHSPQQGSLLETIQAAFENLDSSNSVDNHIEIQFQTLEEELLNEIERKNLFQKNKWLQELSQFNADSLTFFKLKLQYSKPEKFPFFYEIVHGHFIPDLHKESDLNALASTISEIQLHQYIQDLIENPKKLNQFKGRKKIVRVKPIVWNSGKEALGTLFADLKQNGIISGTADEIHEFIIANFIDVDGDAFSKTTLEDNFRKSPKSMKKADGTSYKSNTWDDEVRKLGKDLMQYLKTQKPKKKK